MVKTHFNIIFETNVLVIYLCFQIYFFMDHHCKTQSELIDTIDNSQKWMFFLQGALTTIELEILNISKTVWIFGCSCRMPSYCCSFCFGTFTELAVLVAPAGVKTFKDDGATCSQSTRLHQPEVWCSPRPVHEVNIPILKLFRFQLHWLSLIWEFFWCFVSHCSVTVIWYNVWIFNLLTFIMGEIQLKILIGFSPVGKKICILTLTVWRFTPAYLCNCFKWYWYLLFVITSYICPFVCFSKITVCLVQT